jgi:hypothetical protein
MRLPTRRNLALSLPDSDQMIGGGAGALPGFTVDLPDARYHFYRG